MFDWKQKPEVYLSKVYRIRDVFVIISSLYPNFVSLLESSRLLYFRNMYM